MILCGDCGSAFAAAGSKQPNTVHSTQPQTFRRNPIGSIPAPLVKASKCDGAGFQAASTGGTTADPEAGDDAGCSVGVSPFFRGTLIISTRLVSPSKISMAQTSSAGSSTAVFDPSSACR